MNNFEHNITSVSTNAKTPDISLNKKEISKLNTESEAALLVPKILDGYRYKTVFHQTHTHTHTLLINVLRYITYDILQGIFKIGYIILTY